MDQQNHKLILQIQVDEVEEEHILLTLELLLEELETLLLLVHLKVIVEVLGELMDRVLQLQVVAVVLLVLVLGEVHLHPDQEVTE